MANRKRDIQMKFWVTEEEKALIEEKTKLLPTQRYGAYLRKMAFSFYKACRDQLLNGGCSGSRSPKTFALSVIWKIFFASSLHGQIVKAVANDQRDRIETNNELPEFCKNCKYGFYKPIDWDGNSPFEIFLKMYCAEAEDDVLQKMVKDGL